MNEYLKNLKRIEFTITMACTGKCIHCSEGDHEGCFGHIDADVAAEAVKKICALYGIQSLMTFGGEPLLYSETVCTIQKTAYELGIPKRQLITNGYFSERPDRIKAVAESLKDCGVNDLLLSVDAFHQEHAVRERGVKRREGDLCAIVSYNDGSVGTVWIETSFQGMEDWVRRAMAAKLVDWGVILCDFSAGRGKSREVTFTATVYDSLMNKVNMVKASAK